MDNINGYERRILIELFSEKEIIDPDILKIVKDMKRNGWHMETLISFLSYRLKITNRKEYIPYLKKQIEIIERNYYGN